MSERLLRKARQGDADAFTELCAPYEQMVYRHCLRLLRNPADAQDATQEAMLPASAPWRASWLQRRGHVAFPHRAQRVPGQAQKHAYPAGKPVDEALRQAGTSRGRKPNPEDATDQKQRERLWAAIAELPAETQAMLTLRYGEALIRSARPALNRPPAP